MPVERAQVDRAELPASGTREAQPARDGGADSWVEPQLASAGLPRVPNCHDLLRVGDCLPFGLGALCLGRCLCSSSLPLLRSTVRAHDGRLSGLSSSDKGTIIGCVSC
jgi:hypothetical protein